MNNMEIEEEEDFETYSDLPKFQVDEDLIWSEHDTFKKFSTDYIEEKSSIPKKDPKPELKYRRAVLNLAKMAGHAYKPQPKKPWKDLDPGWNVVS